MIVLLFIFYSNMNFSKDLYDPNKYELITVCPRSLGHFYILSILRKLDTR